MIDNRGIWWLASYPKSGNTWVRMFINTYITNRPLDINAPFQFVLSDVYLAHFQSVAAKPATQFTHAEQFYYRPAMLLNLLYLQPVNNIMVKTHHANAAVEDIPIIPARLSKGAIYIVRDPRDIAISYAKHIGKSINTAISQMNNMQQAGDHPDGLIHLMLTWSKHVESWTTKNSNINTLVIRYEDLVSEPDENFRKIINFLGFIKINEERFSFAMGQSSFENMKEQEEKFGFKEKSKNKTFFNQGKVGHWKSVLTKQQIAMLEEHHGEVMSQFSYKE